ncbi:MAG TPA: efflux RND transporter periplasmic adaptor subunit [Thermoanaerobaculia bacterium]|jgi:cobalt-zinc-cadmium efflux system membrane fusion protein|nr:efflux RND transporter periplasmic adaptor subunit [Thermoanaerobaculia bacterium]
MHACKWKLAAGAWCAAMGGLTVAAMLAGCARGKSSGEAAGASQAAVRKQGDVVVVPAGSALARRLRTEKVRAETAHRELTTPAVVEAVPGLTARIFPPVSGHLVKLSAQLGDRVSRGQVLATINSPDYMAAQSDYVRAKSTLDLTARALRRQQELLEAKIAARREVEQAQNDYDAAKSSLVAAEGKLRAYGIDPERDKPGDPLVLRSPVSGRVIDVAAGIGEFRSDTTAPLMTIADLSTVWLTASVQEKDIRSVAKGQAVRATLAAYPQAAVASRVIAVGEVLDPDTRSTKVRIVLPNPDGRYRPGMYATVTFLGYPEEVVTVPTSALVQIGGAAFVFTEIGPGEYKPVTVEPGPQKSGRTEIRRGLAAGTVVVAENGVLLQ